MKIKWINLFISCGLTALATYGLFLINVNETYKLLCIVFGIQILANLTALIAITTDTPGIKHNINAICFIFLLIFIIIGIVFSRVSPFRTNLFIIIQGIVSLLYLLVLNSSIQTLKKINKK